MTSTPSPALEDERPYLMGVAYRMLGSASDAEDVVQEALIRAAKADGVQSLRAYLTTVVTRMCIDELRSARRRRETYVGPWLPEPMLTNALDAPAENAAEHKENVSFAFLVLLEQLSPLERAVFVLREVFDLEFHEIAQAMQRNEAACRKLLSRARTHLEQRRAPAPAQADTQLHVAEAFFRALATGDLNEVVKLLAQDVSTTTDHGGKASAAQKSLYGPERVGKFFVGLFTKAKRSGEAYSVQGALLNGAPGLLIRNPQGELESAILLRISADAQRAHIQSIAVVRNPDKLQALAAGKALQV